MFRSLFLLPFSVICAILPVSGQQFTPDLFPCSSAFSSVVEMQKASDADASNYLISLRINTSARSVQGSVLIDLEPLSDVSGTAFDLTSELVVDSVLFESGKLSFTHINSILNVTWPRILNAEEAIQVEVFYHGTPEQDKSWGGFYFTGNYAFNLGVGFTADPHTFGRAWFPCFDNFTDRATYEFKITTEKGVLAQCNGLLIGRTDLPGDLVEHHWKMRDPVPTYLASVAVAPYTENTYMHNGIPVRLSAVAADSVNMAMSFANLPGCIDAYTLRYGNHTFERIGFNLVPFNGGAMEHATNIAYPIFGAKGNKTYETLWAHELAHHWWGNTVTCSDQSDMWINEGWASFSEKIFLEEVYGRGEYTKAVNANHLHVLRFAHWLDGDTLAISGVDHARTYGTHVYKKGADVAHTLRGYMGDSAFFKATVSFINAYKFKNANSIQMRDHFQSFTSADLTAFFDQWVFNPGFPNFDILSVESEKAGNGYRNTVRIRQRVRFAPKLYTDLPMMLTAYSENGDSVNAMAKLSGYETYVTFNSDFLPELTVLDREDLISDAVTWDQQTITAGGNYSLDNALMTLTVSAVTSPVLMRVEHNWVRPDDYFTRDPLPVISRERYWKVDGIWPEGFKASARIYYDGKNADGTRGGLDVNLIRQTEDSLVLMYREGLDMYWQEYDHYTKVVGSPFDKFGYVTIDVLKKGEYTFAMYHAELLSSDGQVELTVQNTMPEVVPNPAVDAVTISVDKAKDGVLEITNSTGKLVHSVQINRNKFSYDLDVSKFAPGIYFAGVTIDNQPYNARRFIVRH